jgi:hypothetical protein
MHQHEVHPGFVADHGQTQHAVPHAGLSGRCDVCHDHDDACDASDRHGHDYRVLANFRLLMLPAVSLLTLSLDSCDSLDRRTAASAYARLPVPRDNALTTVQLLV